MAMSNLIDREKPLSELPEDVPLLEASSGWNYAKQSYAEFFIQHSYMEGDDLVTDSYRLPRPIGKLIESERGFARKDLQRELRVLLGGTP